MKETLYFIQSINPPRIYGKPFTSMDEAKNRAEELAVDNPFIKFFIFKTTQCVEYRPKKKSKWGLHWTK